MSSPRHFPASSPINGAGAGFPVSHGQDECLYGDFVGEVMSCGSSDPTFSVSSELTTATCQEDWSGASGMPVIVGRTVLGIIKSVPDRLDNRELHAVPAARIRADPDIAEGPGVRYTAYQTGLPAPRN